MTTRFEHSAGGVVVRESATGADVALASRRTRAGTLAWGLPKGLVEHAERPEDAAVREVREETGLVAEIRSRLEDVSYWFVWDGDRVNKTVSFFLMQAVGGDVSEHDHEMEDVRWFPMAEAIAKASYRGEQKVLRQAARELGLE